MDHVHRAGLAARRRVLGVIARRRRSRIGRQVGRVGQALWSAYENDSCDPASNGEAGVLAALQPSGPTCIFDVGCFRGDWAAHALRLFPAAAVHCFEIAPTNHPYLIERLGREDRVVLNLHGLAALPGAVPIYQHPDHPDMTSTVSSPAIDQLAGVSVPVTTADAYAEQQAIDHVDFLKVDAEGADLDVLSGAHRLLTEQRIDVIQFEFTLWAAIRRTWLADFYDLLVPHGFHLGKVFPEGVEFRPHRPEDEIFVRANYVAVHASRADLVERMS